MYLIFHCFDDFISPFEPTIILAPQLGHLYCVFGVVLFIALQKGHLIEIDIYFPPFLLWTVLKIQI